MTLDPVHREELRKLSTKATPGPWKFDHAHVGHSYEDGSYRKLAIAVPGHEASPRWNANAAYIAAMSPDTTLALLAYIAELEAGLVGARERFARGELLQNDGYRRD